MIMDENITNKGITILIAEDEESNFLLLKTILKKHCNILHAKTGVELLEIYKEQHADLILLDIKMPEMNGIDALKEIRKFDQDIPIIMQSAYAFENDMEAARQAGSNGKDWILEYIILEIKALLRDSSLNIQEIVVKTNFANQSSLGRFFRKHTGMSPSEYRKSMMETYY